MGLYPIQCMLLSHTTVVFFNSNVSCLLTSPQDLLSIILLLPVLEPFVNIVPHYSGKDNTLIKIIVRKINLGGGHPATLCSKIHCMDCAMYDYCITVYGLPSQTVGP